MKPRLPRTVILLGLTSFFTDVGSEMIFPLLGVFLTTELRAGAGFLGLIEGGADTVASLLKLASGWMADRAARKKPLVVLGYALASAVRPLVAFASAPWHVLTVRVLDRVGKGLRSSPRDALIADASDAKSAGRAFGFHRAMDHAGAVLGSTLAAIFVAARVERRDIFLIAAVPGVLATLLLLLVREPARPSPTPSADPIPDATRSARPSTAPLPRPLKTYLAILLLFALANSSDAFLLVRAHDLGVTNVPLLWTVLHVSKLVSSYLGGDLADRVPRRPLIAAGWLVFAVTYLGLAAANRAWHAWALFVIYGTYYGLTEPAEKALVKDLAPADARGRAYGAYNFIFGASALPAGLVTGGLWKALGPAVALGTGAAAALGAATLLLATRPRDPA